jgi:hypothetical protein
MVEPHIVVTSKKTGETVSLKLKDDDVILMHSDDPLSEEMMNEIKRLPFADAIIDSKIIKEALEKECYDGEPDDEGFLTYHVTNIFGHIKTVKIRSFTEEN